MIYSNKRIVTPGRQGTTKDYFYRPWLAEAAPAAKAKTRSKKAPETPSAPAHDPGIVLGEINGRVYRAFPEDFDIRLAGPQLPEIDFRAENDLGNEIKAQLRDQSYVQFLKQATRDVIGRTVGDPDDQRADQGKLTEFAVYGVCLLLGHISGLRPLSEEDKTTYGGRAVKIIEAVESGALVLRASFDDPEKMITEILPRYSKTQTIVNEQYIQPLKDLGLDMK